MAFAPSTVKPAQSKTTLFAPMMILPLCGSVSCRLIVIIRVPSVAQLGRDKAHNATNEIKRQRYSFLILCVLRSALNHAVTKPPNNNAIRVFFISMFLLEGGIWLGAACVGF